MPAKRTIDYNQYFDIEIRAESKERFEDVQTKAVTKNERISWKTESNFLYDNRETKDVEEAINGQKKELDEYLNTVTSVLETFREYLQREGVGNPELIDYEDSKSKGILWKGVIEYDNHRSEIRLEIYKLLSSDKLLFSCEIDEPEARTGRKIDVVDVESEIETTVERWKDKIDERIMTEDEAEEKEQEIQDRLDSLDF